MIETRSFEVDQILSIDTLDGRRLVGHFQQISRFPSGELRSIKISLPGKEGQTVSLKGEEIEEIHTKKVNKDSSFTFRASSDPLSPSDTYLVSGLDEEGNRVEVAFAVVPTQGGGYLVRHTSRPSRVWESQGVATRRHAALILHAWTRRYLRCPGWEASPSLPEPDEELFRRIVTTAYASWQSYAWAQAYVYHTKEACDQAITFPQQHPGTDSGLILEERHEEFVAALRRRDQLLEPYADARARVEAQLGLCLDWRAIEAAWYTQRPLTFEQARPWPRR